MVLGPVSSLLLLCQPSAAEVGPRVVVSERTATCTESEGVEWSARYQVSTTSGDTPTIRIIRAAPGQTPARPWTLWWSDPGIAIQQTRADIAKLSTIRVSAPTAHLLAPDDACTLILSAAVTTDPVAVIGDSVFAGIANSLLSTALPGLHYTDAWQISAIAGFGWSASAPSWPLTSVGGSWVIGIARGVVSEHPSTLVVELGANDALRAAFADVRRRPDLAERIRNAVASNVSQLLDLSAHGLPCTILVTAPTATTSLFAGGSYYSKEATLIDAVIRSKAASAPSGQVEVADWAVYSSHHHGAQGSVSNWFLPDGVHPNAAGEAALVGLVRQTMARCSN